MPADPRLDRASIIESIAALKHDLGKYSSWISANLADAAWEGPVSDTLVEALESDLLRTRRLPGGEPEAVWEVWARLGRGLLGHAELEPELGAVAAAVGALQAAEAPLRAGDRVALAPRVAEIRAAQRTIRAALLQLHRRLLRGAEG